MSSVEEQPLGEAVREEEEKEAAEEKILDRKELSAQRKQGIPRLILGIAGVAFMIWAVLVTLFEPQGEIILGYRWPYLAYTLLAAGIACLTTAISPGSFLSGSRGRGRWI